MLQEPGNPVMHPNAPGRLLQGAGGSCPGEDPVFSCGSPVVMTQPVLPDTMACRKAERLAAAIVFRVVLLCTLAGQAAAAGSLPQQDRDETSRAGGSASDDTLLPGIREIFPAPAGTAGRQPRTLLHP